MSAVTAPLNKAARIIRLSDRYDNLKARRAVVYWARFNALTANDIKTAARADDIMARLDQQIDTARRHIKALLSIG